jgi:hypothetical protein
MNSYKHKSLTQLMASQMKDHNFRIFLCFGQSNMAGQAPIEEQDLMVSDRFLSMATTDGPDYSLPHQNPFIL